MNDNRPTTLLDDNWGASRPLTDEEWAAARRLERWRFYRVLVILAVVMSATMGICGWVLFSHPVVP